jgi:hypothetical protein
MNKIATVLLLAVVFAASALYGKPAPKPVPKPVPKAAPEIDPGSLAAGSALASSVLLMVRGRRKR